MQVENILIHLQVSVLLEEEEDRRENLKRHHFMLNIFSSFIGNIQEAPSQMGAPLSHTNNTTNNNNNSNNNDVMTTSRKFSPENEKNDSFELNEHDEDANVVNNGKSINKNNDSAATTTTVNGRLDINIKEKKAYRERNYH